MRRNVIRKSGAILDFHQIYSWEGKVDLFEITSSIDLHGARSSYFISASFCVDDDVKGVGLFD